jgi:hypothetical protein
MIDPLELPVITESLPPPPLISPEEALRWRIAKAQGTKAVPREEPQGEPFVWIDPLEPRLGRAK